MPRSTDWEQDAAHQGWGFPPEPGRERGHSSSSITWPVRIYTEPPASLWGSHLLPPHHCTQTEEKQLPTCENCKTRKQNYWDIREREKKNGLNIMRGLKVVDVETWGSHDPVLLLWPAGNGGASVTRWRCRTPKGLPEFFDVVELEVHHHVQSSL